MNYEHVISVFKTERELEQRLEKIRWGRSVSCPYCLSNNTKLSVSRHHCNNCNTYFNVKIGTVFHNTKIDLRKWLYTYATLNESDISSRDLAKLIKVTKDTAWLMLTKLRSASNEDKKLLKTLLIDLL
jgi:transposase-like protein